MAHLRLPKEPNRYRITATAAERAALFDPVTLLPKKRLPGEIGTDYYLACPDNPLPGHRGMNCRRCRKVAIPPAQVAQGVRFCPECLVRRKVDCAAEANALERAKANALELLTRNG